MKIDFIASFQANTFVSLLPFFSFHRTDISYPTNENTSTTFRTRERERLETVIRYTMRIQTTLSNRLDRGPGRTQADQNVCSTSMERNLTSVGNIGERIAFPSSFSQMKETNRNRLMFNDEEEFNESEGFSVD